MKQKVFLLMVLALGMCNINVNAQRRLLQTEKNGFKWYIIWKDRNGYGAEGEDGSTLIPLSRGYNHINFSPLYNGTGYFEVERNGKVGACDITGKEIIAPDKYDMVLFYERKGYVGYYEVEINGKLGVCDITGKEIIPCRYRSILYITNGFELQNSDGDSFYSANIKLDKQGRAYSTLTATSSSPISNSSSSSTSSEQNGRMLHTEENGFKWYSFWKDKIEGAETENGTTLIPLSREYYFICFHPNYNGTGYFEVWRNGKKKGACDVTGKEIIAPGKYDDVYFSENYGHGGYFRVKTNGKVGACDITGKEIMPCIYNGITYSTTNGFEYQMSDGGIFLSEYLKLDNQGRAYSTRPSTSPYSGRKSSSSSSSSTSSSSSSSSSKKSNSGNNTTTIVVEHHRDPVPVQEWIQCPACLGSGQCPFALCSGRGWYYSGDRSRTCSRCQGSGKCTSCAGRGGTYMTVYR